MLVPILSAPKEPPNTSVSQEPCAVKCCPYFASWNHNKLEVLIIIPVRLSNRCEFILVRSVFILHDTGKYTRRHSTKDTRETRASAKIAWGVKT